MVGAAHPSAPLTSPSPTPVQGFRDLLWLPIEQFRKDGRLMRGLQRGAASFGSSTASAALELSNRLVQAIQVRAPGSAGLGEPATASGPVPKAPLTGQSVCRTFFDEQSQRGEAK